MKLAKWMSIFAALALVLGTSLASGPVLAAGEEKPKAEGQEVKDGGDQPAQPTDEAKPEEKKQ
jgi:hypothetical protein